MSEHIEPQPHPDAVTESIGGAYWVDEDRWEALAPALPDECVDLLAPPIVVCAAPAARAV